MRSMSSSSLQEKWAKRYSQQFLREQDRLGERIITDIPVLFGVDGSVICIPRRNEPNNIAIVGKKGTGKCLWEETEIFTTQGIKKIKDIEIGDRVMSINKQGKVEEKAILKKERVLSKNNVKIITESGEEIICSEEHKFLILDNNLDLIEKKIKDIDLKFEYLIKVEKIPAKHKPTIGFDWDFGFLIGIYLAEGCLVKTNNENRIEISNTDWTIQKTIENLCRKKEINCHINKHGACIYSKTIYNFLAKDYGSGAGNKKIPIHVKNENKEFIKGLLSGYLNGEGCINGEKIGHMECGFVTKSKKLGEGIQELLLSIGINSIIKKRTKEYNKNPIEYYYANILNIKKLRSEITIFIKSKDNSLKLKEDNGYYFLPYFGKRINKNEFLDNSELLNRSNQFNSKKKSLFYKNLTFSRLDTKNSKKSHLKMSLDKSILRSNIKKLAKSDIFAVKIKKVEKESKEIIMYCLEVKDNHNFMLANTVISCNSLLLHRCADEIFWLWNESIFLMNDVQEECLAWNNHQENTDWRNQLEIIDEKPLALPIIYIYPHTNTLNIDYSKLKNEINFIETTIPFSEIIDNANIYLNLGDTSRYIRGLREELLNCEVPQDIVDLIESKYPGKNMEPMRNKILISFDSVFDEEILNITNKQYPFRISTTPRIIGNPFVILSKLGVVPCFETSDLFTKRYMPQVFAYHLNMIFQSKFRGGLLENETTHIFFDEITHICSDDDKNPAYESLCKIAARGRKLKIGIIYATQNYTKIPRKIKSNTDYVFAFQHSNEEEVKRIAKDYDLGKLDWKEILHLESFEIIAITNEHFVCYKEGERWVEKGPIKGTLIPPLSNHQKPR